METLIKKVAETKGEYYQILSNAYDKCTDSINCLVC